MALALLAILNRCLASSFLYPPALFAGVWTLYLTLLWLSGESFFQIGEDTLSFYFCAALAFSLGGLCVRVFWRPGPGALTVPFTTVPPERQAALHCVLDGLLIILVAALPVYWRYVVRLASQAEIGDLWAAIRLQMIVEGTENTGALRFMDNLVVLALILALIAYYEDDGTRRRRIRTCLAVGLAFVYTFTTATRASGVTLVLCLLALHWLKHRRVTRRALLSLLLVFVIMFSTLGILLRKGEAQPEATLAENVSALVDGFLWYSLGGIVAFDAVFHEPTRVPPTQSVFRPLLLVANKLGANLDIPPLHAEYIPIGPAKDMNVYTMYFSYFPACGRARTMLVMFILGFATTAIYDLASAGNRTATFVFAVLFAGIVLSAFAENLISSMNFTAKLLLVTWALYGWAGRSRGPARTVAC
ncbi:MAG TPA: O-antigen polymerase [Terriglobales bacterium]